MNNTVLFHYFAFSLLAWLLAGNNFIACASETYTADSSNEMTASAPAKEAPTQSSLPGNTGTTTHHHSCPAKELQGDEKQIRIHAAKILEDLNNKIQEHENNGDNYFRRAFVFYRLKEYKQALNDCDQAMGLGVDHARIHLLKGEILFAQKKYNEALSEVNKSIELNSNKATAYALAAEVNSSLKEYARALQYSSKAIDLDPQNAHYYEIRADLAYTVEQYERCIKDCSQTLVLNPKSKVAYLLRSKAYMALNDLKQAKLDATKAKELAKDKTGSN